MNAISKDFPPPSASAAENAPVRAGPSQLSMQWAALHDAASAVAILAGLAPEKSSAPIRNFPALIRDAGGRRLERAEKAVADLAAIMQPGLRALLAVNARGQDAGVPALTLWHEFLAARQAILALAPENGALGPRRSA